MKLPVEDLRRHSKHSNVLVLLLSCAPGPPTPLLFWLAPVNCKGSSTQRCTTSSVSWQFLAWNSHQATTTTGFTLTFNQALFYEWGGICYMLRQNPDSFRHSMQIHLVLFLFNFGSVELVYWSQTVSQPFLLNMLDPEEITFRNSYLREVWQYLA